MVEYQGLQPTNNSIMHGTSLALIVLCSISVFQLTREANHTKKMGAKNWLQKSRNMELYEIYNSVFHKIFSFFKMKFTASH